VRVSRRFGRSCVTSSVAASLSSPSMRSAARTGPAPTTRSGGCSSSSSRRSGARRPSSRRRASRSGSSAGWTSCRTIGEALDQTAGGERLRLNIAFNYAGRTELVDAVRKLVAGGIAPDAIDEAAIAGALYTAGLPDPDLVIRTGGEQRLSNFLIWQSAYAEFYSTEVLWPDFGPDAFDAAVLEFARRTRRFGR
jgi:Putative undecaprenyl diphosphate synthase